MKKSIPSPSYEIRWFFTGKVCEKPEIQDWFENTEFAANSRTLTDQLLNDKIPERTDLYLLIPNSADMGIKWRENNFQVKGLISSIGLQLFAGVHLGNVERWIKWSYKKLPDAYEMLFRNENENGLETIAVGKKRQLRKFKLDTMTSELLEVPNKGKESFIDRGISLELTEVTVNGKTYTSLGFESFPDDTAMNAAFCGVVENMLSSLTQLQLKEEDSLSYPDWLGRIK